MENRYYQGILFNNEGVPVGEAVDDEVTLYGTEEDVTLEPTEEDDFDCSICTACEDCDPEDDYCECDDCLSTVDDDEPTDVEYTVGELRETMESVLADMKHKVSDDTKLNNAYAINIVGKYDMVGNVTSSIEILGDPSIDVLLRAFMQLGSRLYELNAVAKWGTRNPMELAKIAEKIEGR
jgi:hypothetical protein